MTIFRLVFQVLFSVVRMCVVGGVVGLLVLLTLDQFLNSDYGVVNLIITIMAFSFFPLFFAIFFEVFFHEKRKYKNNAVKLRNLYTNK